jgi:peptidoglycan/LPS O-acetylase OafA/YrhL
MKDREKSNTRPARLPELDGLRAIAILLVLFFHSSATVPLAWFRKIGTIGWTGVDLFFVLSGFLIGGMLLDQRTAVNYYQVFYLRRFFRIVPLYAVLVLPGLVVLGFGLQKHFAGHSLADLPSGGIWFCPFFLQNISESLGLGFLPKYLVPTWSIATEEQFYLLLPFVIRYVNPPRLLKILLPAIMAAPLLRGGLLWAFGAKAGVACYDLLPCRWDAFLLGVVGAYAFRSPRFRIWLAGGLRWLHLCWWLSGGVSAVLLFYNDNNRLAPEMSFVGYTIIDVFFTCTLVLAVMNPRGRLRRGLQLPVFGPIAAISYGLYMIHSPMLAMVEPLFHRAHITYPPISWTATLVIAISVALAAVVAAMSWKFFESPLIQTGHRHRFQKPSGAT